MPLAPVDSWKFIDTPGPHCVEIVTEAPVPFPKQRTSSVTLPVNDFPSEEMLVIGPVFPGIVQDPPLVLALKAMLLVLALPLGQLCVPVPLPVTLRTTAFASWLLTSNPHQDMEGATIKATAVRDNIATFLLSISTVLILQFKLKVLVIRPKSGRSR